MERMRKPILWAATTVLVGLFGMVPHVRAQAGCNQQMCATTFFENWVCNNSCYLLEPLGGYPGSEDLSFISYQCFNCCGSQIIFWEFNPAESCPSSYAPDQATVTGSPALSAFVWVRGCDGSYSVVELGLAT